MQRLLIGLFVSALALTASGCKDEDDLPPPKLYETKREMPDELLGTYRCVLWRPDSVNKNIKKLVITKDAVERVGTNHESDPACKLTVMEVEQRSETQWRIKASGCSYDEFQLILRPDGLYERLEKPGGWSQNQVYVKE